MSIHETSRTVSPAGTGPGPIPTQLRPATAGDVRSVADVYLRSRAASVPAIPPGIHPDTDVRDWVATTLFADAERLADHELWVAVEAGTVVGFMVLSGDWIGHLYLEPGATGRGTGSDFVQLAKARRPGGLQLWTFESNSGARRFYERHGFVAVERTDGTNEEGEPDVRYRWLPAR